MEDEALIDYKSEGVEGSIECESGCNDESFADLIKEKGGERSSNSEILLSEMTELDGQSQGSAEDTSSSTSMGFQEMSASNSTSPRGSEDAEKKDLCNENFEEQVSGLSMSGIQIQCAYVHNLCLSFWFNIIFGLVPHVVNCSHFFSLYNKFCALLMIDRSWGANVVGMSRSYCNAFTHHNLYKKNETQTCDLSHVRLGFALPDQLLGWRGIGGKQGSLNT